MESYYPHYVDGVLVNAPPTAAKKATDISGIKMVDKSCHHCGRHFRASENSKAKFCSRYCIGSPNSELLSRGQRKKVNDRLAEAEE